MLSVAINIIMSVDMCSVVRLNVAAPRYDVTERQRTLFFPLVIFHFLFDSLLKLFLTQWAELLNLLRS
jgi:hypothetical protein